MTRKILGRYIVADSKICHGKVTFSGTRIFVDDVLDMVAEGMDWDIIIREWHGNITREAIREALLLAKQIFQDHAEEYAVETISAIDDWLRSQDSRAILLQQAGALADDELLSEVRTAIYSQRGGPK